MRRLHLSWPFECYLQAFICVFTCVNHLHNTYISLCVCVCVLFRTAVIMTHTLTGFMELMDHGIVSWENLSSVFIEKVLYLLLSDSQVYFVTFVFSDDNCTSFLPPVLSDCQLRQRQGDRCIDSAGVLGHPGEHGSEQPKPLSAGQTGSHYGEAYRSPPGVSIQNNKTQIWTLLEDSHTFVEYLKDAATFAWYE